MTPGCSKTGWRYMMLSLACSGARILLAELHRARVSELAREARPHRRSAPQLSQSADPEEVREMLDDLATREPGAAEPRAAARIRRARRARRRGAEPPAAARRAQRDFVLRSARSCSAWGFTWTRRFSAYCVARSLNLLATMIVVLVVDRVGRKPLLILGALIMGAVDGGDRVLVPGATPARSAWWPYVCYMVGSRHVVRSHRVDHDVGDLPGADSRPGDVTDDRRAVERELPGVRSRSRSCSATARSTAWRTAVSRSGSTGRLDCWRRSSCCATCPRRRASTAIASAALWRRDSFLSFSLESRPLNADS